MTERKENVCKLIKEQLKPDLVYAMRQTRHTEKETGFNICELPVSKQWVPGYRRVGTHDSIVPVNCDKIGIIDGRVPKHIGSFHVHPVPSNEEKRLGLDASMQSGGDAVAQATPPPERIACVGAADTGKMNCYRPLPAPEIAKVKEIENNRSLNETDEDFTNFLKKINPVLESAKICSTTVEFVGVKRDVIDLLRRPKKPPLRY